jgi:Tol biopolymer transport system component
LAVALIAVSFVHFHETPPELPVRVMSIDPPEKAVFNETAISPDGKLLAFTATAEGKRQLWVRPLNALAAQALAGTEQAEFPFWSPDSRRIGFFVRGKVKKIDAAGGPAQTLCDAPNGRGGAWNAESLIVFADRSSGLFSVPSQGGIPAPLTTPERTVHRWPVFLPGGRRYVFLVLGGGGINVGTLESKEHTRLAGDRSSPAYAEGPAGEGYLLFVRAGTLMAQRLDASQGRLLGEAFPVAEKVGVDDRGRASFSVSGNGLLVVEPSSSSQARLAWVDRTGKRLEWVGEPVSSPLWPRLSPDEKRVALSVQDDIWVRDLVRGLSTRITFHSGGRGFAPVLSPDGGRIVYSSNSGGADDLYVKSANGTGQEERLLKTINFRFASDWTAGGQWLLYSENDLKTKDDLWVLPMEGERKPVVFLRSEFNERDGAFSPDGNWIAYASDESGRYEIYVQPYPATGAKWQVSKDGGHWPRWRADGRELYWLEADGTLMAAEVSAAPAFRPGIPQPLFETRIQDLLERYAVSRDGKRFLVPMPVEETEGARPLTVIQNWLAGAKR